MHNIYSHDLPLIFKQIFYVVTHNYVVFHMVKNKIIQNDPTLKNP